MNNEIAIPEFIGDTEQAVIMVVPALDQDLSVLYRRFHEGEDINYWFKWELVSTRHNEYVVTLEIGWDLMSMLPEEELKRIKLEFIRKYHPAYRKG